jgi:hypothetical protein
MADRKTRRLSNGLAGGLLLVALAGCGVQPEQAASGGSARANEPEFPSLYIDRKVEVLNNNRNMLRDGYLERVEICRGIDAPLQEIPAHEVELIGTERWQLWRDRDRVADRVEHWTYDQGDGEVSRDTMCRFRLSYGGSHVYADAGQVISLDLATGERSVDDGRPELALSYTGGIDDVDDGAIVRSLGTTGPERKAVAGQPCDEWRARSGATECIWTGLVPWGIGTASSGIFDHLAGMSDVVVALASQPAPGTMGPHVTTLRMTVGEPLDRAAMMPAP